MTNRQKDEDRVWAVTDRTKAPAQRAFARRMRSEPTAAERKLWWHLRHRLDLRGTHFRRQVRIGPYIVDLANHKLKMVIEIDGSQHVDRAADDVRSRRLEADGYRVLRFWNNDVLSNIDGVLSAVHYAVTPTPDPSSQGGGEK